MRKKQGVAERKFHEREQKKKQEVETNTAELLRGFDEAMMWQNGFPIVEILARRRRA